MEFQNIVKNFIYLNGKFITIPFSKSEVFKNPDLSLADKRKLVKLINMCLHFHDQMEMNVSINSTHVYEQQTHVSQEELDSFNKFKD